MALQIASHSEWFSMTAKNVPSKRSDYFCQQIGTFLAWLKTLVVRVRSAGTLAWSALWVATDAARLPDRRGTAACRSTPFGIRTYWCGSNPRATGYPFESSNEWLWQYSVIDWHQRNIRLCSTDSIWECVWSWLWYVKIWTGTRDRSCEGRFLERILLV